MTFLALDWSGARNPAGKLWLAEARDGHLHRLESFPSREAAIEAVVAYGRGDERVVAGFDFSFSLPLWFHESSGVHSAPAPWQRVSEQGEAWLAACEPPFWGRPGKPRPEMPAPLRATEEAVGRIAAIKPKSTFQVGGAGAVGTGSLRGMPYLLTLQRHGWAIWPFDVAGRLTAIEIYPRLLTGSVVKSREAARRAYLESAPWALSAAHRGLAEASEDAFDAAVSALVMAAHAASLAALPERQGLARREGEIWHPVTT